MIERDSPICLNQGEAPRIKLDSSRLFPPKQFFHEMFCHLEADGYAAKFLLIGVTINHTSLIKVLENTLVGQNPFALLVLE